MENFILYTAGAFEWRQAGSYLTLEELKKDCIKNYGFPEEVLKSEEEFKNWLDGTEMKYEKIKVKVK